MATSVTYTVHHQKIDHHNKHVAQYPCLSTIQRKKQEYCMLYIPYLFLIDRRCKY